MDFRLSSALVMLLDCCAFGQALDETGATLVFAASGDYAFEQRGNGLFTRHLLDWIRGDDGIRRAGVVSYVTQAVRRETGGWQSPVFGRM